MNKAARIAAAPALLGAFLIGAAAFTRHAATAAETQAATFQGEVVDLSCYTLQEARGQKHAMCARSCLAGGAPAGLLTASGEVFLLVDNHRDKGVYAKLKRLGGAQATVTGKLFRRGGIPIIAVDQVAAVETQASEKAAAPVSPMQNFGSR